MTRKFFPGDMVRFGVDVNDNTGLATHMWGRRPRSWYRIRAYTDETFFACVLGVVSWNDVYDNDTFENTSRLSGSTTAYVVDVFGLRQELIDNQMPVLVEPKLDEMNRFMHSNIVIIPVAKQGHDWVNYVKIEAM